MSADSTVALRLRPVQEADCRLLWEWINDPTVRQASFHSGTVDWEEHVRWFAARREDARCRMFLVLDGAAQPVGQVRVELAANGGAEIDLSIAAPFRGQGYAAQVLRLTGDQLASHAGVRQMRARIKPENAASIRVFERAGFVCTGGVWVKPVMETHGCS